jgi:hypothetical protein
MTISEKKIELVQALLLLQDKTTLFEIEKLIAAAFKTQKNNNVADAKEKKTPVTFEAWATQFEAPEHPDKEDEYGMTPTALRQRIWAAEQGRDMNLEEFFECVAQN